MVAAPPGGGGFHNGGEILLALLVLGGLFFGVTRLRRGRRAAQHDDKWVRGEPPPSPSEPPGGTTIAPARTPRAAAIVDHGRVIRQGPIGELIRGAGAVVVQVDCAEPARAARLIDEAGIAAGAALAHTGLTVTLPAGASRELVAEINRRLVGASISVYGLRETQASLEDWFLSVTSRLGETS